MPYAFFDTDGKQVTKVHPNKEVALIEAVEKGYCISGRFDRRGRTQQILGEVRELEELEGKE